VCKISLNMDGNKPKMTTKTDSTDLKLIPNGPIFFDGIPNEMKHAVLNYLCDCGAFIAAAVCQEWREISDDRLGGSEAAIGEVRNRCEDNNVCEKPESEEMFKAAAVHKLDLTLIISKPVTQIDKKIVAEALMNVSEFTVINDYIDERKWVPILSTGQFEHFLESIEKGDKIMEVVKLEQLKETFEGLNQENLTNFLVSRVKKLTMDDIVFDVGMFLTKLLDSPTSKLTHLTLECISFYEYADENPTQVADALCKVRNVELCGRTLILSINDEIMERLIENMLQRPIMMKTLVMSLGPCMEDFTTREESLHEGYSIEYYPRIDPQDLVTLFTKMEALTLEGFFTEEQLKSMESLPEVNVNGNKTRGSEDILYSLKKSFRRSH